MGMNQYSGKFMCLATGNNPPTPARNEQRTSTTRPPLEDSLFYSSSRLASFTQVPVSPVLLKYQSATESLPSFKKTCALLVQNP